MHRYLAETYNFLKINAERPVQQKFRTPVVKNSTPCNVGKKIFIYKASNYIFDLKFFKKHALWTLCFMKNIQIILSLFWEKSLDSHFSKIFS